MVEVYDRQLAATLRTLVPPKRYKIGELAEFTGLSRQTLHNYTRWGLINEVGWTAGGHRLYDESVFARLVQIMELKNANSVDEIRELLDRIDQRRLDMVHQEA